MSRRPPSWAVITASSKGTAGLAIAIRGVGAGNLAGGVVNAYFERLPLVAVCEADPAFLGGWSGVQHCDQKTLFAGVAKLQADLAASNAEALIRDAFRWRPRAGPDPVILGFPGDAEAVDDRIHVPASGPPGEPPACRRPAGGPGFSRGLLPAGRHRRERTSFAPRRPGSCAISSKRSERRFWSRWRRGAFFPSRIRAGPAS